VELSFVIKATSSRSYIRLPRTYK